jgi:anion-transporting  ArsA/GET3 family ATPase
VAENTSFVVVTSFDAAKLLEARYLQDQLKKLGYRMRGVVINRAFPEWLPEVGETPASVNPEIYDRVLKFYERFKNYYSSRYALYDQFAREIDPSVKVVRVPEYQQDIYGLDDLSGLAKVIGS